MAVKTVKTLLEQMNDALKGKIVYWESPHTEMGMECAVIVAITKGGAVVDKRKLPERLRSLKPDRNPIKILDLDKAILGIYEGTSLN